MNRSQNCEMDLFGTIIDVATKRPGSIPAPARRKTVDGLVFQWLGAAKPDGLGLSKEDVGIAGRILKGHGNSWSAWGIGALMAADRGTSEFKVLTARKIAKGVVPEWALERARELLKKFEAEV